MAALSLINNVFLAVAYFMMPKDEDGAIDVPNGSLTFLLLESIGLRKLKKCGRNVSQAF